MLLLLLLACMECEEVDPGRGCDLVQLCCNDAGNRCEYRTREDVVHECYGGKASCDDEPVVGEMLCDVCDLKGSDPIRDLLNCDGFEATTDPPEHP